MAVEGTQNENLAGLSAAILSPNTGLSFSSFEDLFQYIDNTWQHSRLFLILCGSSMSFMEHQVLGYKSPLYGRHTAQFKLHPFTYFEARQMLPSFSPGDQAYLYVVTGGIPEYLRRIQPSEDLDTNLINLFFNESGRLFEEPTNLLKQELKEPASYHSIISAIASGHSRMNEIATNTGLESSGCSYQISSLISLGIVKKEILATEKENSRSYLILWGKYLKKSVRNTSSCRRSTLHYPSQSAIWADGGAAIPLPKVRRN